MRNKMSFITKNIFLLSLVSFLTDIASEMLFPVMPIYLKQIGYGVLAIGVIEGLAEATAGLNKVFFGHLSDVTGKRNLFIRIGYGISAFAKPLIGLAQNIGFIFSIRFLDRIGKGIRTAPRDATLASESKPEHRGRVFGFHRSMDTLGAMLGPIISLAFLYFYPSKYKEVFLLALIPGVLALISTLLLTKEKSAATHTEKKPKMTFKGFLTFWQTSNSNYKKLLLGFLFLALINSSNMFLIFRAKELGMPDVFILSSYIFYNLIFALSALPLGYISDKFGFKWVYVSGILVFALVYSLFGFGFATPWLMLLTFGLYGIFASVDESTTKAWLSLHVPPEHKATGLGLHLTLNSLGLLFASLLTAFLWETVGPKLTFTLIGTAGVVLATYFAFIHLPEKSTPIP